MSRRRLVAAGLVAAASAASAASAGAAPAWAGVPSYAPSVSAVGFSGGSELHVLWHADGAAVESAVQSPVPGGPWVGPLTVPGSAQSDQAGPSQTAAGADGEIVAVWEGPDAGIEYSVYTRSGWSSAPAEIPGSAGTASSAPTVMSWKGGNEVDVFWRGTSGGLMQSYADLPLSSWKTPYTIPGPAAGAPGVLSAPTADVSHSDSQVDVFWQGTDGGLYETSYVTQQGWTVRGRYIPGTAGTVTSAPTAVGANTADVNVYYRNATGAIDEITFYGSSAKWGAPHQIPATGGLTSAPSATLSANAVDNDLVWEAGGQIERTYWTHAAGWPASALADVPMSAPAPAPPRTPVSIVPRSGVAPVSIVPRHRRRGSVRVGVVAVWHWYPRSTVLRRLAFHELSRRASVTLTCAGVRCPRTRWSARPGHVGALARGLSGRVFHRGSRLTLTIAQRGRRSERVRMLIRAGRRPRLSLLSR